MVCDPGLSAPSVGVLDVDLTDVVSKPVSGEEVVARVGYTLSDIAFVHPIPGAPYLGQSAESLAASGHRNHAGDVTKIKPLQTAAGAGGVIHGALSAGAAAASFVHSHSLVQVIPSLHSIARDRLPGVFHVAARSIDESLVLRADHTDVLAARFTGATILASATPQEAHDLAVVAHIAASTFKTPVLHFFDGTTVPSSDASGVDVLSTERLAFAAEDVRRNGLAGAGSAASRIDALFEALAYTSFNGRRYRAFEYYGPSDAETVVVLLGAEPPAIDAVLASGVTSVGVVNVRVYRPFDAAAFVSSLPAGVRRVVVADRTTDASGVRGPLFVDVGAALFTAGLRAAVTLHGARIAPGVRGAAAARAIVAYVTGGNARDHFEVGTGSTVDVLEAGDAELAFVEIPLYPAIDAAAAVKREDEAAARAHDGHERAVVRRHYALFPLLFPTAFEAREATRPELDEKTFTVTVTENRRLTPDTYDRNVFHLEFDTTGSNLTYEIGDALGVHGHNDPQAVDDFIDYYGLNPEDIVVTSLGNAATRSLRTVRQVLQQEVDLFGRPTKAFYQSLAKYATVDVERQRLERIAGADGAAEFKRRVDETSTFADVLLEFRSARPPLEHLLSLIPEIKPRHYSIASSQRMHPNSVHLLVVLVEWETPSGRKRTGQCTRYLASLAKGAAVTVSIKPSVMKLPPLDSQPVIMAGLGTGMAPFRAFVQERAARRAEGHAVGPMSLYFGSRSRHMEYLYGEELEAYHRDGLLTNLRLAFSRDGPDKVYIQHKIAEDKATVSEYLLKGEGHFYLCGPTWPAADVRDAIVGAFVDAGVDEKAASDEIERLKEEGRYILEVY